MLRPRGSIETERQFYVKTMYIDNHVQQMKNIQNTISRLATSTNHAYMIYKQPC